MTDRDWALFLDFDGTLVEIAPTPDGVQVPGHLSDILLALARRLDDALAIVTGRDLGSIERFLPASIDICAFHGLEWRRGDRVIRPDLPSLAPEIERLIARFRDRPGVLVEDKGIGLALHWRLDPSAEAEARREVEALARRLGPPYRVQDGKAVCELVPGHAGKGDGIRAMLRTEPYRGRRPCFIGDDRTDEHGFAAAIEAGGLAVKVGGGNTAAQARLPGVSDVLATLAEWAATGLYPERLPGSSGPGSDGNQP